MRNESSTTHGRPGLRSPGPGFEVEYRHGSQRGLSSYVLSPVVNLLPPDPETPTARSAGHPGPRPVTAEIWPLGGTSES